WAYGPAGRRYDPLTDTWTTISTVGAPPVTSAGTVTWTGSSMFVWGGCCYVNTGALYNPALDSWTPISTTNAPTGRSLHTAVWTGRVVVVWGGFDGTTYLSSGGRYDPG